jgi:hypothetical protein
MTTFKHHQYRAEWIAAIKRTISRFARGNVAAQNARILMPEEQADQHERAQIISRSWKKRSEPSSR